MIVFNWYSFSQLTSPQLYTILALRSRVFIVEQHCVYQDIDGSDLYALHLLGMEQNELVAYLRLFPPSPSKHSLVFGRVVTEKSARSQGYGKKLIKELITYCERNHPGITITCSAQNYLTRFYADFGFKIHGDIYQEDGIPHVEMRRAPTS